MLYGERQLAFQSNSVARTAFQSNSIVWRETAHISEQVRDFAHPPREPSEKVANVHLPARGAACIGFDILERASCQAGFCDEAVGPTTCQQCASDNYSSTEQPDGVRQVIFSTGDSFC